MAMRKPFLPPSGAVASGDGAPPMPMGPQAGRMDPMPPTPMGGGMQPDDPMQGMMPGGSNAGPMGAPPPMTNQSPGGPTAPGNISQMLTAKMGSQGPGGPKASTPLPPWGGQGTRPGDGGGAPGRVPYSRPMGAAAPPVSTSMNPAPTPMPGMPGMPGAPSESLGDDGGAGMSGPMMMSLMRRLGKF